MELEDRKKSERHLERQIDELREELSQKDADLEPVAEVIAEAEAAKGLREQIGRLKRELEKKEGRIATLSKALGRMEDVMVKNAEESTELQIRRAQERSREVMADQPRFSQLEGRLDKFSRANEALRKQCAEKDETLVKLKADFGICQTYHRSVGIQTTEQISKSKGESGSMDMSREQWEADKKLQKKMQDIKSKLNEKIKECEETSRREILLKEALERTERDRARLHHKLSSLSEKRKVPSQPVRSHPSESDKAQGGSSISLNDTDDVNLDPDMPASEVELHHKLRSNIVEISKLQQEKYSLESKINSLRRIVEVDQINEITSLEVERQHLKEQVKSLEELNDHLRRCNTSQ
ncbi:hypothetical protein HDU67_004376, partial [Dinochytrium kinnereticum]